MRSSLTLVAAAMLALPASAQVVPPSGWTAELLVGRMDNKTQRIEAIRNPAYGPGVAAASISNGILTVRRINDGQVAVLGTRVITASQAYVLDLRFDTAGLFGDALYISVVSNDPAVYTTEILRVDPNGTISSVGVVGGPNNDGAALTFDFTAGAGAWTPGAYLEDLNGQGNFSSFWRWTPPATFTRLSASLLPAGRTDLDVRGVEFDRAGTFGSRLLMCDADANETRKNVLYALNSSLQWSVIGAEGDTNTIYFRDLALSPGGALGQLAYLLDARQDRVLSMDAAGTITNFATGFTVAAEYDSDPDGAASLTITDDGDTMYVSDTNGIYRLRLIGNQPGPTIVVREPSLPPGVPFTNPEGIAYQRVLWSAPITFVAADLTITDAAHLPVPFSVSGSGSAFMLITFSAPLLDDAYTITINDTVKSLALVPIDGDEDGLAGGDAVFTITHEPCENPCPGDFNGDGLLNIFDFLAFQTAFGNGC